MVKPENLSNIRHDAESQAAFNCLNEEKSKCASKKSQLYNDQLNKFQQHLLDTSRSCNSS